LSIRTLYTLLIALILLGCSSREEFSPPDNPFDPGNPDYVNPEAEIISGPTEGEIVESTSVTMVWEGNESATEYRYKFDSITWSDWGETTSQTFHYLDEGIHSLEVQARSVNGDEQTLPTLLEFEVNAVTGPSALVYPYMHIGNPGDTLIYQIVAEEVTDLFAVECLIEIDTNLELIDVIDGNLQGEWGGHPLIVQEIGDQSISLSIVSVEGANLSFAGTSSIISLRVRIRSTAVRNVETTALIIANLLYLNTNLDTISISTIRPGVIYVL